MGTLGAIGLGVVIGIVIGIMSTCLFVLWLGSLCDDRNDWRG